MSWYDFDRSSLDLDVRGELTITYTCPRCGFINHIKLNATELSFGREFYCANTKVCGEQEMKFELSVEPQYCSYKGHGDVPLNYE